MSSSVQTSASSSRNSFKKNIKIGSMVMAIFFFNNVNIYWSLYCRK